MGHTSGELFDIAIRGLFHLGKLLRVESREESFGQASSMVNFCGSGMDSAEVNPFYHEHARLRLDAGVFHWLCCHTTRVA